MQNKTDKLVELDHGLVDAIENAKAVLFLGAGASIGAKRATGENIPLAKELGQRIATRFLGDGFEEADFKTICDFAASSSSVRDLQTFIHEQLTGFEAAPFHLLIPKFIWAGILTTNYDLVIEAAYRSVEDRYQDLIVNAKDGDGSAEDLGNRGVLYVKLHGCINRYQEVHPPLIASTEQIINHRTGRAGQFAQFLEWAKTKTIIFVGYGMGDFNLRALFEEIKKDGDNHSRHYIVRPKIHSAEKDYWAERRVRTIDADFSSFLNALDKKLNEKNRKFISFIADNNATSFTRFISKSNVKESPSLLRYLESACEHVSNSIQPEIVEPSKFYKGFDLGWSPILQSFDVRRHLEREVLETDVITVSGRVNRPKFIVVKGHAGGGKTVLLRRVAWEAATTHNKLVFFVKSGADLDKGNFEEIISLTNQTIFLVIDDLSEDSGRVADFVKYAKKQNWPVVFIGAARVNEWNVYCEELEEIVDDIHELRYLSKGEIDELLRVLEDNDCLGQLKQIPKDERRERLQDQYGRQLLVALHEATENATFRDIIQDEFDNIVPAEAKILYLDICSLHRFGPPVRAGLISRVHDLDFDEFNRRFFLPLEQVIDLAPDRKTRDWTYKARHSVIAEIVYSVGLPTIKEKYDNLVRIIGKLNPNYSYDKEVLFQLIRSQKLAEIFKDVSLGRDIYQLALDSLGDEWGIFHQLGIYEMRLAIGSEGLDRAEAALNRALQLQPTANSVRHSLAELALKRSLTSETLVEREAWRKDAVKQATALKAKVKSSYPAHTMAKVAIARVRECLEVINKSPDALSEEALNLAIKEAEDVLRSGLQSFPNDDRLLTEDAALSGLLKDADRALEALQKAFTNNPRSELIAKRLSRILRARGENSEAIQVLRETLSLNMGSQALHYDLAQCIRESAPDADISQCDSILHHLQRSFIRGDKQYEARFWYARQLTIAGKWPEARSVFDELKKLTLPFRQRTGLRGTILNPDGTERLYYGQVINNRSEYAFIRADQDSIECFTVLDHMKDNHAIPSEMTRVQFNLAFSLRGPVAINVREL